MYTNLRCLADVAFTVLAIFAALRIALRFLPQVANAVADVSDIFLSFLTMVRQKSLQRELQSF
jgi:hypothetical protein